MTTWRQRYYRYSTRLYRPDRHVVPLSWIGEERIAVGNLPLATDLRDLPARGVTHVLNCRSRAQIWLSQDLAVERAVFGPGRVVHVPLIDLGQPQHPRLWSAAAHFAAGVLTDDPHARLLIHCHQGRRRSVMMAYAVLRLRGHTADAAIDLISRHRAEAVIVEAYAQSVEAWLAAGGTPIGLPLVR
ncbi:protein-tyrosine phosphatase family protein [Phytohabitans kaempferiae]|uniref:Tyrosine specific protein phosphatases domain-containing protein n=1 Tax=Phytohabitans kaempferiae TaxID=1620943 RepID=A0ABV6MHC0_9ACTN